MIRYLKITYILIYRNKLSKKYSFCLWEKIDDKNSAVRFCTSWATKKEDVEELVKDIENLKY